MNKKKLPKAIMRGREEAPHDTGEPGLKPQVIMRDTEAAPQMTETGRQMHEGSETIVGTALVVPQSGRALVRRRPPDDVNAVRRLTQAEAIVERHATYAAAGGLLPVPLVNVASV